jgi:ABC-type enterochelin transport system permease subunit
MAIDEGKTSSAVVPVDFQNLCNSGMDRLIGIEKASLTTVVCFSSCILAIYKSAFWFVPELGKLFDTASESLAFCTELQLDLLDQLASLALPGVSTTASSSGSSQSQPRAEVLAYSMDIAIGEQFTAPRSTVTGISGGQAPPQRKVKAQVLEHSMDIAIGARAA